MVIKSACAVYCVCFDTCVCCIIVPVWKACRASCATPKFFTSFNDYVDGGVLANNSCEYAISEISRFYRDRREKEPEFSIALSVGTGYERVGDIGMSPSKVYDGKKQLGNLFEKSVSFVEKI